MSAETVDRKARRLLDSGKVEVVKLMARLRVVNVRGDSGVTHRVVWQARLDQWRCSCRTRPQVRCSHIAAAELAVLRRLPPQGGCWHSLKRGWRPRLSP
jgi:hypothetical protein